jgi:putative tryptophan/tyrosine transport system substrate-binding protein
MRRRRALALLAGSVTAWPPMMLGQPFERLRAIGVLIGLADSDPELQRRAAVFRHSLQELGWTENHNIRIHYRSAADVDQLRLLGNELIAMRPDVIVASSSIVARTLLLETRTIPIVFVTASDPVGDGLVAGLAQPKGNATGFTGNLSSFCGKWLQLLQEIAIGTTHFTAMFNPGSAPAADTYFLPSLQVTAATMSLRLDVARVHAIADVESAFATLDATSGIIVLPDQFANAHRYFIVESAARHRVPTIYPFRTFTNAGGLISYGVEMLDLYRRVATYVDRILKGAKPADLPVQSPAKFELVVNQRAAAMLGIVVPRIMLARADEVIE